MHTKRTDTINEISIYWALIDLFIYLSLFGISGIGASPTRNKFIAISNCTVVPLVNCPMDESTLAFREQCINQFKVDYCPIDSYYMCGTDITEAYMIETCLPNKECFPGKSS